MEIKTLLKLIKDDLSNLDGIVHEFENSLKPTPEEVELALVKADALTRQLALLQKAIAEPILETVRETEAPVNLVPNQEIKAAEIEEIRFEQAMISENTPSNSIDDTELNIQEQIAAQIPEAKTSSAAEPEKRSIVIEEFLDQEKIDISYPLIPLPKIADAIGINDRFLFIHELFANESSAFDQAIQDIDQLNSIEEAVIFLKKNFKWTKNEASQKFLILVKRRFSN
jgi:hypothetical protein